MTLQRVRANSSWLLPDRISNLLLQLIHLAGINTFKLNSFLFKFKEADPSRAERPTLKSDKKRATLHKGLAE